MTKYIIEVSLPEKVAAKRISQSIRAFGSHFATRADWAHTEVTSSGTLVVDADDRRSIFNVIPPNMRSSARIVELDSEAGGTYVEVSGTGQQSFAIAA